MVSLYGISKYKTVKKFKRINVAKNFKINKINLMILASVVFVLLMMPIKSSSQTPDTQIFFSVELYNSYTFSPLVTVFDPNFVGNPAEPDVITVKLTSDDDPGFMLILKETGADSKLFENDVFSSKTVRFLNGDKFIPEGSGSIHITYEDVGSAGQEALFFATSSSEDVFISSLTETEPFTGIFEGEVTISNGPVDTTDNILQVSTGDTFTVGFACGDPINYQIIPRSDVSTFGGIRVDPGHKVYAEYTNNVGTFIDSAEVIVGGSGCGGSGGGLVISPVVLDVLAGGTSGGDFAPPQLTLSKLNLTSLPLVGDILDFILNADPFTAITPLDDPSIDYPVSINGNGYLLTQFANTIQTYTGETGEPISFKMTLFDATGVEHIALYTNLRGDAREVQDSDTYITYNEDRPLEITDPHGYFSNVNFTESEYNGKYLAEFNMTFTKPMDTSDVIIRTWDEHLNSGDIKVFDAIKIEGEPIVNPDTNNLVVPDSAKIVIPYYKLPYYEIPNADSDGNLIYYNSFGGLEEKKVQPESAPIVYPDYIGKAERHDDGFYELIINEDVRAQTIAKTIAGNPFSLSEDNQKDVKFYFPSNVGKLDRENKEFLKLVMEKEYKKAEKISEKTYGR